jgi:hypothetical protein
MLAPRAYTKDEELKLLAHSTLSHYEKALYDFSQLA